MGAGDPRPCQPGQFWFDGIDSIRGEAGGEGSLKGICWPMGPNRMKKEIGGSRVSLGDDGNGGQGEKRSGQLGECLEGCSQKAMSSDECPTEVTGTSVGLLPGHWELADHEKRYLGGQDGSTGHECAPLLTLLCFLASALKRRGASSTCDCLLADVGRKLCGSF